VNNFGHNPHCITNCFGIVHCARLQPHAYPLLALAKKLHDRQRVEWHVHDDVNRIIGYKQMVRPSARCLDCLANLLHDLKVVASSSPKRPRLDRARAKLSRYFGAMPQTVVPSSKALAKAAEETARSHIEPLAVQRCSFTEKRLGNDHCARMLG